MHLKPDSSSTPNTVPRVSCRKPISQTSPLNEHSPIQCVSKSNMAHKEEIRYEQISDIPRNTLNADHFSSDEFSDESTLHECIDNVDTSTNIQRTEINNKALQKDQNESKDIIMSGNVFNISNILYVIIFGITVYCIASAINPIDDMDKREFILDALKTSFPNQDVTFWFIIESGVSEIINFNKPSTIILTYTNTTSKITDKLLEGISKYASCSLNNDCSIGPILLSGKNLDIEETKRDYGILIDRYSSLLDQKHIMIVKDIDNISGIVAQAFHSFCDEYTPVVNRALFLFTIEVDELYKDALKQAVDILRTKWSDVDNDILEPLITRVSNMVLQIK